MLYHVVTVKWRQVVIQVFFLKAFITIFIGLVLFKEHFTEYQILNFGIKYAIAGRAPPTSSRSRSFKSLLTTSINGVYDMRFLKVCITISVSLQWGFLHIFNKILGLESVR